MSEEEKPLNADYKRRADGTFGEGNHANDAGRPKGQSLKEFDREKFAKMDEVEKEKFLKSIAPELRYKMAEGNPANATELSGTIEVSKIISIDE